MCDIFGYTLLGLHQCVNKSCHGSLEPLQNSSTAILWHRVKVVKVRHITAIIIEKVSDRVCSVTRVTSKGVVKVVFNVLTKNMHAFGYSSSDAMTTVMADTLKQKEP